MFMACMHACTNTVVGHASMLCSRGCFAAQAHVKSIFPFLKEAHAEDNSHEHVLARSQPPCAQEICTAPSSCGSCFRIHRTALLIASAASFSECHSVLHLPKSHGENSHDLGAFRNLVPFA